MKPGNQREGGTEGGMERAREGGDYALYVAFWFSGGLATRPCISGALTRLKLSRAAGGLGALGALQLSAESVFFVNVVILKNIWYDVHTCR